MKSNKQRREELREKKQARAVKRELASRLGAPPNAVPCNRECLAPDRRVLAPLGCFTLPDFVERGYYLDKPFTCIDCGKAEVWTATQQKWWYEIAKGDIQTTAVRCRKCRRTERERKNEARRLHLEGLERKKIERSAKTKSTA